MSGSIAVHITYHAFLREKRGRAEEEVTCPAGTGRDLFAELSRRHGWMFPAERFRLAVNDEFRDWSTPLRAGDRVAFIPPVAGGCGCSP
jgi:molybdopterin synthase sulfur carrier subunit